MPSVSEADGVQTYDVPVRPLAMICTVARFAARPFLRVSITVDGAPIQVILKGEPTLISRCCWCQLTS